MQKFIRFYLVLALVAVLALSACGGDKEFGAHSSSDGLMPEAFLPGDAGIMFSYSLQDDDQFSAVQAMESGLSDDGKLSRTIVESLNAQFEDVELSYEDDLLPAFGEQFRLAFASRPNSSDPDGEAEAFIVSTLADPDMMTELLDGLVEDSSLEMKRLSDLDAYVDEKGDFYASVYGDLLFVANSPEGLVAMPEYGEGEDSLWESEQYKDGLEEIGSDYVFYGMIFPDVFSGDVELPAGLGLNSLPSITERQAFVVRAEDKGLAFDALVKADQDSAEEAGVSFDTIPRAEPYLFEEVPSDGLMAYIESYGLQQTYTYKTATSGDDAYQGIADFFRAYFAMDFEEDILSFLGQGYVFALHQNGIGVVPGITFLADVSDDVEGAQAFVDKFGEQMSGLMLVLETALPGAVAMETTEIMGEEFNAIRVDLTAVEQTGESPLPALVTDSEISLAYGMIGERLLITTALVWEEDGIEMIGDSSLYQNLSDEIDGLDEGLVLIDAQNAASFVSSLRALREQLDLGVDESSIDFEEFLEGFMGAIASGSTDSYSGRFGGFLMIAN